MLAALRTLNDQYEKKYESLANALPVGFSSFWLLGKTEPEKDRKARLCFKITEVSLSFFMNLVSVIAEAAIGYYTLAAEPNANPRVLTGINLGIGFVAILSAICTTLLQGLGANTDSQKDLRKLVRQPNASSSDVILLSNSPKPSTSTIKNLVLSKGGRRTIKYIELFTSFLLNALTATATFAIAIYILIAGPKTNQKMVAGVNLGLALFASIATLTSTFLNALGAMTNSRTMSTSGRTEEETTSPNNTELLYGHLLSARKAIDTAIETLPESTINSLEL